MQNQSNLLINNDINSCYWSHVDKQFNNLYGNR